MKYTTEKNREYQQRWRDKDPNRAIKSDAKKFQTFYATIHGRAVHMLENARRRAKKNGVNCSLTWEWLEQKLSNGKCEVSNIPFDMSAGNGKGHRKNSWAPSVDRINQMGDYSPENCRMTVWIYNRARGAFPPEDFDRLIKTCRS
jgi:hypothetical protein